MCFQNVNLIKSTWFISGCGIINCQCHLLNEHTDIQSNLVNVQIKCMSIMYCRFNITKLRIISSGFAFKHIDFYVLTFRKWVISHTPWWQRGTGIENQFQIARYIRIVHLLVYQFLLSIPRHVMLMEQKRWNSSVNCQSCNSSSKKAAVEALLDLMRK